MDVVTPKIDQALEKFRQRKSPFFTSEMSAIASDADTSAGISVSLGPLQGQTITCCKLNEGDQKMQIIERSLGHAVITESVN